MSSSTLAHVYAIARNNFVRDLSQFVENMVRRAFEYVSGQRGFESIRPIYLNVIPFIPSEGIRLTALCSLLDMFPQHLNDLIGEFEQAGFVIRRTDPSDQRARIVFLTARGKKLVQTSMSFGRTLDKQCRQLLSPPRFNEMEAIGLALRKALHFGSIGSQLYSFANGESASQVYGDIFQSEIYALGVIRRHLEVRGHLGQREPITWLLTTLTTGEDRIKQLAVQRGISVQAMGRIVKDAESLGYVAILDDLTDKRRKAVVLTEHGAEFISDLVDAIAHLETEFKKILGVKDLAIFKQCLADLNPNPHSTPPLKTPAVLVGRGKSSQLQRFEHSRPTKLQLLLYIARLFDEASDQNEHLTATIFAQTKAEKLLVLEQQTLNSMRLLQAPLDTMDAHLQNALGESTIRALRKSIAKYSKSTPNAN